MRTPEILWLSANPSFRRLEQPILLHLRDYGPVAHWGYCQTPDEPSSLEVALSLLQEYMDNHDRPLHIIGHSTGGLLGLLYARQFPEQVKSLTMLSVGVNPAIDWKAYYYEQLKRLPCGRVRVLTQMVHHLLGPQSQRNLQGVLELLEQDLDKSLSLHSLWKRFNLFPGGVSVPLMVCGGEIDAVVTPTQLRGWQPWLKASDRLWMCPRGRHFFHTTHAQDSAERILDFWSQIDAAVHVLA